MKTVYSVGGSGLSLSTPVMGSAPGVPDCKVGSGACWWEPGTCCAWSVLPSSEGILCGARRGAENIAEVAEAALAYPRWVFNALCSRCPAYIFDSAARPSAIGPVFTSLISSCTSRQRWECAGALPRLSAAIIRLDFPASASPLTLPSPRPFSALTAPPFLRTLAAGSVGRQVMSTPLCDLPHGAPRLQRPLGCHAVLPDIGAPGGWTSFPVQDSMWTCPTSLSSTSGTPRPVTRSHHHVMLLPFSFLFLFYFYSFYFILFHFILGVWGRVPSRLSSDSPPSLTFRTLRPPFVTMTMSVHASGSSLPAAQASVPFRGPFPLLKLRVASALCRISTSPPNDGCRPPAGLRHAPTDHSAKR
jgi:hypothetical protein